MALERILIPLSPWWAPLAGAAAGFSLLYAIAFVTRGKGMGGGDIKLFAVLGLALGWKLVLLAFFLSCLAGSLAGGIAMLLEKQSGRSRCRSDLPSWRGLLQPTFSEKH